MLVDVVRGVDGPTDFQHLLSVVDVLDGVRTTKSCHVSDPDYSAGWLDVAAVHKCDIDGYRRMKGNLSHDRLDRSYHFKYF